MRRWMVLLMLALGTVALGPAPAAHACDLETLPFDRQVDHAQHIFSGTVTRVRMDPAQDGARRIYDVRVDEQFKGDSLQDTVRVVSPTRSADCGLVDVTAGDAMVFFVGPGRNDHYEALTHQGTRPRTEQLEQAVAAALAPAPPPEPVDPQRTVLEDGEPISFARAVAPGFAVVVLGLVALVVGALFGRPRHGH